MIRPRLLLTQPGDPVSFDPSGDPVGASAEGAPAMMVVASVTDALKLVSDGMVTGPVDREEVARLVAFSLSRSVLGLLGDGSFDAAGLIDAVRALGTEWVVVPQEELLRPFNAQ